jgi:Skp family chaperone for outer membrane proteins
MPYLRTAIIPVFLLLLLLPGCQRAYYSTMEKFGYQKREILTSRVEKAQKAQEEASEQFRSALDRFRAVIEVEGGELEEKYEALRAEFERSETRARAVRDRIGAVENVAGALFDEWDDELEQYRSEELRRSSRRQLAETRRLYDELIRKMHRAEARMDPVLASFRDQVLFLKHNLNARAVTSLRTELGTIELEVENLIRDMEASIREAETFLRRLEES